MTDSLRELDRQCAELLGLPDESDDHRDCDWTCDGKGLRFSSDPAAASILIEDLSESSIEFNIRSYKLNGSRKYDVMEQEGGHELSRFCDTWTEAVARFYCAVKTDDSCKHHNIVSTAVNYTGRDENTVTCTSCRATKKAWQSWGATVKGGSE